MMERRKVEEELKKHAEEKSKFEIENMKLDFEKREDGLKKQLEMSQKSADDLSRKLNQGSMQIQ
jgi:hypothetical protein